MTVQGNNMCLFHHGQEPPSLPALSIQAELRACILQMSSRSALEFGVLKERSGMIGSFGGTQVATQVSLVVLLLGTMCGDCAVLHDAGLRTVHKLWLGSPPGAQPLCTRAPLPPAPSPLLVGNPPSEAESC